ncbi:hypothetical protein C808_01935 [Lachnospiraceae bacterium M18-1]|nr:hypothetical protein C808_01935 [Lachnospiraceae bacterium M18-1]
MYEMVPVLLIGRGGSRGVKGKNTMEILGRPLMEYPIMAARNSKHVGQVFLSTDADYIKEVGKRNGVEIMERAPELCTDSALVEDVVVNGYNQICERMGRQEIFVLLFCNSATISQGIIDKGIEALWNNPTLDSAVSVSLYNEYSPVRAKAIDDDGFLIPYVDVNKIDSASCDRDSAKACYFCDCSVWVLRDRCMDKEYGILPFRWMGRKTLPLFQEGGLDIDHDYGIAQTEYWLKKHGFSTEKTPYK